MRNTLHPSQLGSFCLEAHASPSVRLVSLCGTFLLPVIDPFSACLHRGGKLVISNRPQVSASPLTNPPEEPGPPVGVRVADVWGNNAALEWKPPKDDGNCEIIGYTVQKADMKTKDWFTVVEHNRRPGCTVPDLVMGNEYLFRVFSENICGLSVESGVSQNTAIVTKTGLSHGRPPFKEKDVNCSPKFTAPLVDRSVVAGYSTAISCAVRGYPKPKIIWMKNNMVISEDPKFLMQNNQGVLTLNIRKPGVYDGGKYSCRAVNQLGEDAVECKLEVHVVQEKGAQAKKGAEAKK